VPSADVMRIKKHLKDEDFADDDMVFILKLHAQLVI
jgi:hypothetical protein